MYLLKFVSKDSTMATVIKIPKIKKPKKELEKELKKFTSPKKDPNKATEELYGIWEERDISIEKIREKSNRNKWLQLMLMLSLNSF